MLNTQATLLLTCLARHYLASAPGLRLFVAGERECDHGRDHLVELGFASWGSAVTWVILVGVGGVEEGVLSDKTHNEYQE